jgi:glycosyltransferase involved in cell wall biosynthesis
MARVSIAIITRNEEANLRACLLSASWADEIVVVDAESCDATVAIAREFTDRVYVRPWPGFAAQKEFALKQCTSPWIFSLDADERIRPELRDEIRRLTNDPAAPPGYRVGRRSYFLHKWIRHGGWYPGYQLRLFRKEAVSMIQRRVHEGFAVEGETGTLQGDLDHFSHPSIVSSLDKMNRYSTLEALDRLGRKRVHPPDLLTHPWAAFLRKYIAQGGFRDARHGFVLAWVTALVKMALYMKIYHLQHLPAAEHSAWREERLASGGENRELNDPLHAAFDRFQRELAQYEPAAAFFGRRGRKPGLYAFVVLPLATLFVRYFWYAEWRDGVEGLMRALLAAAYGTAREIKLWESGLEPAE